ncbi:PTS sugar transporter subunit IIA [Caldichromatium japonicum]|uniref:PTS sugar transporter subunit IIA n=1 Tax=Caldichromatium japonicum TaxID=2699430 RepID=A0A6G7VAQ8_9GAMM|nr:PTS sugar transporter subunit IIA [Caldichromatium japonicum]QIK36938.1 PTS sugar transporter subunit IIA [Caldichromatium japonicum]
MSVGILLLTHRPLAGDLLKIAAEILGALPPGIACCEVIQDTPPEEALKRCRHLAAGLDQGEGVLVLTDLYGATPANIAHALAASADRVRVISGLNLPMLLRMLNYAHLDLEHLTEKALSGGRDGVRE